MCIDLKDRSWSPTNHERGLGVWQSQVCHMIVWGDIQWGAMRRPQKWKVPVAGVDGFYTGGQRKRERVNGEAGHG